MKARKIFQSKLFNGVITDDKKFRLIKGTSGSDISAERFALIGEYQDEDSDIEAHSTRHSSLGNKNNLKQPSCAMCTLPKTAKQDVESHNFYNRVSLNDNDPETIL